MNPYPNPKEALDYTKYKAKLLITKKEAKLTESGFFPILTSPPP